MITLGLKNYDELKPSDAGLAARGAEAVATAKEGIAKAAKAQAEEAGYEAEKAELEAQDARDAAYEVHAKASRENTPENQQAAADADQTILAARRIQESMNSDSPDRSKSCWVDRAVDEVAFNSLCF